MDVQAERLDLLAADQRRVDAMWAGVGDLAQWTQRESTCVQKVGFEEGLEEPEGVGVGGVYDAGRRRVRLREDSAPTEVRASTREAFCHAIDHELEWVSEDSAGAFDQAIAELDPELYPTLESQQHQVFAGVCQAGPESSALLIALAQECSDYGIPPQVSFVQQAVFPHWSDALTESYAWDTQTLPLLSQRTQVSAISSGAWLLMVEWIPDPETGLVQPQLDLVDAKSAEVVQQLSLPEFMPTRDANGNPRSSSHTLLSVADGALLMAHDPGVASWQVEVVDGELYVLPYSAPDLGAVSSGHQDQGHFLYATYEGGLAAWVHDFGQTEPLLWQGSGGQEGALQAFWADPEGALLAWMVGPNLVIEGRDKQGQSVWSWSLPISPLSIKLSRTPAGQILLAFSVSDGDPGNVGVSVLLDPETGSWRLPEGERCGAIARQWLTADGELVALAAEEDGLSLIRVVR